MSSTADRNVPAGGKQGLDLLGILAGIGSCFARAALKYATVKLKQGRVHAQPMRLAVQWGFAVVTISIGWHFGKWVNFLGDPAAPPAVRPPGVEAFLPISALISLKQWFMTGVINNIHPSGLVIFVLVLLTGILLKKGFCSWICPVGLFSEFLARLRITVFNAKSTFVLPKWLDYPLRSLKYLLLWFFLNAILIHMNLDKIETFVNSPYNRVADIKMMMFFTDISQFALNVLFWLVLLSFLFPYFWCRYLCPYGALLGALGIFSPMNVRRNTDTCTNCEACTKVCPAAITVHKLKTVVSDECHACLKCVDSCPVNDTLYMGAVKKGFQIKPQVYAFSLAFLFVGGIGIAQLTGNWHNGISLEEYRLHYANIDSPIYTHSQGEVAPYDEEAIREFSREFSPKEGIDAAFDEYRSTSDDPDYIR